MCLIKYKRGLSQNFRAAYKEVFLTFVIEFPSRFSSIVSTFLMFTSGFEYDAVHISQSVKFNSNSTTYTISRGKNYNKR